MLRRWYRAPGKLLFWAGEGEGYGLLLTEQGTGSAPGPVVSRPPQQGPGGQAGGWVGRPGQLFLGAWGRTSACSPGAPLPSSRSSAAGYLQSHFTDEETKASEPLGALSWPLSRLWKWWDHPGCFPGLCRLGRGRRGQERGQSPRNNCPQVLQGLGQGAPSQGGGGTRTGRGLRKEVWGVLVSSRPTQWATRCSCQDTRASPIPPGCQGAASGPWPQAQAPGTPGKGLPESGGPPHCGHLILSTHTCPSRCQCQTLAGSRQGDGLPVSH